MEIQLVPIHESPEGAELALTWALELWGDHIPNYTQQDWVNFYTNAAKSNYGSWVGDGQELIYIAKRDDEIMGTIAVVDFDELEEYRHLSPWIAAFIVNPNLRGQGIGSRILSLLEEEAKSLGIRTLHLWTEDQSAFYLSRGFNLIASGSLDHLTLDVMQKELAN